MHGGRHSVSEFDQSYRGSPSNMQNFYANQRYQGSRHENPDQMMQAKRRMAAQRERELRNYHQEQQYNRSEFVHAAGWPERLIGIAGVLADMSSTKSDRSMSPSGISEEGRRDLLARQHRALYSNEPNMLGTPTGFSGDEAPRVQSGSAGMGGPRGPSPRGMDRFGPPGAGTPQDNPEQSRSDKPSGPPTFGGFEQVPTNSAGVAEEGGHSRQLSKSTTAPLTGGMAPIGSRPGPQNPALNKRTTSPMPAGLSYGFGVTDPNNERSTSSNSNNNGPKDPSTNAAMGAWGTGSGVWGNNKIGGANSTSVWG